MVVDHSTIADMKSVPISSFKTHLLALLSELERSGEPILVTRRGKPVARVEPARKTAIGSWRGRWKGKVQILGDIMAPACAPEEWEVLRD